jgi:hypothetical protein
VIVLILPTNLKKRLSEGPKQMKIDVNRLVNLLEKKGWKQCELGRAANFFPLPRLSSILRGWQQPGPSAISRLLAGLRHLGASEDEIEFLIDDRTNLDHLVG